MTLAGCVAGQPLRTPDTAVAVGQDLEADLPPQGCSARMGA